MVDYLKPVALSPAELRTLRLAAPRYDAYRFLDLPVTVHSDSPQILSFFRQMYRHFLTGTVEEGSEHHAYHILTAGVHPRGPLLLWDEDRTCVLHDGPGLADSADIVILGSVLRKNRGFFLIHGAALCSDGRGVVLAGMSGSGKTTLALELMARGLGFCSDEIAAISRETHLLHPFPRGIGARSATVELLRELGFHRGRVHETVTGEQKRIVDIMDLSASPLSGACRGRYLVMLETDRRQWSGGGQGYHDVRVALKSADPMLLGELGGIDGVQYLCSDSDGAITSADFRVAKDKIVQRSFLDVCRRYDDTVLYRVKVVARPPDPAQKPEVVPLSKFQAGVEVLGNLQNVVANDGWMSAESTQSNAAALFELLGPIAEMKCYRLLVGNLRQTADVILDLLN